MNKERGGVAAGDQKCYFPVAGAEVEIPAGLDHKQGGGSQTSRNTWNCQYLADD